MELKYISPNKILMIYGLLGIIIYLVICISSSFPSCHISNEDFNYTKVNDTNIKDINISIYLCEVKINDTNQFKYYFENFSSFFSDFNFL